jgi:general secretion pathway protein A
MTMWYQNQPLIKKESTNTGLDHQQEPRPQNGGLHATVSDTTIRLERDKYIVPTLLNFFGLTKQPFGVSPDPSFLYLSRTHREALASLVCGIETGLGFLALIAKPGMGKTTLLFSLLEKFRSSARSAFVFQTQCTSREFMQFLISELGYNTAGQDFVRMQEEFNSHLLREARAGKRFLVVIDEAQDLDPSVLETVRLLSNFETPHAKLLQIVLAGQPELADKLAGRDMVQLRQRLSLLNRLEPFCPEETELYIQHRLRISGYSGKSLLTSESLSMLVEFAQGIPRNINNLCFNAMSLAFASRSKVIDAEITREVIADLDISRHLSDPDFGVAEKVFAAPTSVDTSLTLQETVTPQSAGASELQIWRPVSEPDSGMGGKPSATKLPDNIFSNSQDVGTPQSADASEKNPEMTLAESVAYMNQVIRNLRSARS